MADELFDFELAGHIGGMTVSEMMERMDVREYHKWRVYKGVRPFGESGADIRSAQIAQAVLHAAGYRRVSIMDFLPFLEPSKHELPTEKELAQKCLSIFGGWRG